MNLNRYIMGLGLLLGTAALTSCEKFLDVNNNPNNPVASTPNFLLPGIISNGIQTQMFTALRTPYITQYVVSRTANSGGNDQYYFTNAQSTNTFNYSYFQAGGNIPVMQKAAEAEGSVYYVGAGKIMQAMILAHATDMLGDIPYSEAYQGGANFTPKYDPQEQIYATINRLCDEGAVEMAKPASANFRPLYSTAPSESGDILYKGDPGKWLRLAYALKARQAQHLTKKSSYDPNAVLALCDKAFTSSADDAQINFQVAVAPLSNTTNIFGVTRANFGTAAFSSNVVKYLNGTTFPGVVDPRFGVLVPSTSTGADPGRGTTTNLTPGSTVTDFYGGWYARDLGYFEAITYHELKFIEAEAALRANNRTRALAALRAGITAHMKKVGAGGTYTAPTVTFPIISDAQINAYLASAAVPQTEAQVTLRSIMEQKYIAMFLNPDSWSDLRRLNYRPSVYVNFLYPTNANPALASRPVTDSLRRYPRRLLPGATEVTVNPNAVAALYADAGATTDNDYITAPLWFDRP
ncbi:SusD/RagB family nutrient-binding outer membrane lipoprotein [Hymenobacter properus]|uniref:SusD/RagB family nutrient-binding outer membrane lipoprotein n=1 Tax=Hymenobacter properus TaxID=2791026 RepID=A0A931BIV9_9BACT|nr:SusD/RagB family nutrient-binding outer membrane lipoprotein [Hymenobacter properus]MBF9142331.1 SusD/RagB family nutrient-binding outer membrane lipoprotein [Hymenobacter properus]MBR7721138.1 SusD/RagB family nutrient-binding outer membrane lipoprotein [Microvirga sp. SRT04]